MTAVSVRPLIVAILVVGGVAAACSGGGDDEGRATTAPNAGFTSTSTTVATSAPATTTTAAPAVTSTTSVVPGVADYSIERRIVGGSGDTVVVLLEPATYSDLDLQNVVTDVIERFAPIAQLHIVDDADAVELVLLNDEQLTPEQLLVLAEHYFVRLEDGFRLVYQGPFDVFGEVILGS